MCLFVPHRYGNAKARPLCCTVTDEQRSLAPRWSGILCLSTFKLPHLWCVMTPGAL